MRKMLLDISIQVLIGLDKIKLAFLLIDINHMVASLLLFPLA